MLHQINRKLFFDSYARVNNLDPLNPETWYNVSREDVFMFKVFILLSVCLYANRAFISGRQSSVVVCDKLTRRIDVPLSFNWIEIGEFQVPHSE